MEIFGSSTWARTRDKRINSPLLYQLSYRGITNRTRVLIGRRYATDLACIGQYQMGFTTAINRGLFNYLFDSAQCFFKTVHISGK